jgi:MATE family multidrug resistance protein
MMSGSFQRHVPMLPTRHSARSVLHLAGPVIVAELGWMTMQVVDTLLVRHLGASAIGAVGIGGAIFMAVAVFGTGLLMGLDPLVAQAVGAGRLGEAKRWLHHGVLVAVVVSVPLLWLLSAGPRFLTAAGAHPDVLAIAVPYLQALRWSLPPLLLFVASRRYLQARGAVRPVMIALLSANLVNAAAGWLLINGVAGLPRLGVVGAAWATVVARTYMAILLVVVIRVLGGSKEHGSSPVVFEGARIWRLLKIGLPAAAQVTLEVGAFALATTLASRLAPASLAAHHIALSLWSLTFMVPMGVASAAAVLVGHGVGRRDAVEARQAGWSAIRVGVGFMALAGIVFLALPVPLMRVFTADPAVVDVGWRLLMVCAVFQLFDALQVVATGALRGLGETRSPMVWNFVGLWCFGLPLGYTLAFPFGWGIVGLWVGLSGGLCLVGSVLVTAWHRHAGGLAWRMPE